MPVAHPSSAARLPNGVESHSARPADLEAVVALGPGDRGLAGPPDRGAGRRRIGPRGLGPGRRRGVPGAGRARRLSAGAVELVDAARHGRASRRHRQPAAPELRVLGGGPPGALRLRPGPVVPGRRRRRAGRGQPRPVRPARRLRRPAAVRRDQRGRGLGLALPRHRFGELYRRGVREVYLDVDSENRTGATRLYERAGMRVQHQHDFWVRDPP